MKLGFIPLGIFVMMFQALGFVHWELLETACWLAAAFVISCTIHGLFLTFHYCYKSRQPRWMKFRRSLLMVFLLAANYLVIWGIAYITESMDY